MGPRVFTNVFYMLLIFVLRNCFNIKHEYVAAFSIFLKFETAQMFEIQV